MRTVLLTSTIAALLMSCSGDHRGDLLQPIPHRRLPTPTPVVDLATAARKEAVRTFEAMGSVTASGIVYADYLRQKATLHVALDELRREQGDDIVALNLGMALQTYDDAATAWGSSINDRRGAGFFYISTIMADDTTQPLIKDIFQRHGVLLASAGDGVLSINSTLSLLWQEADDQVRTARGALQ